MKFKLVAASEITNELFGQPIEGSKEDRSQKAREPEFVYMLQFIIQEEFHGTLTIYFKHSPFLSVGSIYTIEEIMEA